MWTHVHGLQTWGDAHAGLLVSERLVNAPPQLAPPLNQALFDEIEWAQDDEPTQVSIAPSVCHVIMHVQASTPFLFVVQELRDSFKLNLYILVSRVFTDPSAPGAVPKKKQKAVSICCHNCYCPERNVVVFS